MDDGRAAAGRMELSWNLASGVKPPQSTRGDTAFATDVEVCLEAERLGIDSVFLAAGPHHPEPFTWGAALGRHTERISFLLSVRVGVSAPTYVVQQANTVSCFAGDRVALVDWPASVGDSSSGVAGGNGQSEEFWRICTGLWRAEEPVDFAGEHYQIEGARVTTPFVGNGRGRPWIYQYCGPEDVELMESVRADQLLLWSAPPGSLQRYVRDVRDRLNVAVGLAVRLPADGPTGASSEGRSPMLAGSASDVVGVIDEYRHAGVRTLVLDGSRDQLAWFGQAVLPVVRDVERAEPGSPAG